MHYKPQRFWPSWWILLIFIRYVLNIFWCCRIVLCVFIWVGREVQYTIQYIMGKVLIFAIKMQKVTAWACCLQYNIYEMTMTTKNDGDEETKQKKLKPSLLITNCELGIIMYQVRSHLYHIFLYVYAEEWNLHMEEI